MALNKIIVIFGIAAFVMQPINSASIGASDDICICTREYFPICGSDDTTYSNNCEFECAKVRSDNLDIKFYGECEDQFKPQVEDLSDIEQVDECVCTFVYDPVCGSDGKTYSSECEFNCAKKMNKGLEVFTRGECIEIKQLLINEEEFEECACTFVYDPVCGSDGHTYSSECEFNCAKRMNKDLEVFTRGECIEIKQLPIKSEDFEECVCTFVYDPVCGSDGNTYSSECEFNCAKRMNKGLEVFTRGECIEIKQLPIKEEEFEECVCTFVYDPVCGSDGNTYTSECEFNCAKRMNKGLELFTKGECIEVKTLPVEQDLCICTMEYKPVCGSDERTYSSECLMGCEQRIRGDLRMKHVGEC